jgi:hypothetical protein
MSLDKYLGTRIAEKVKQRFIKRAAKQGGSSHVLQVLIEGYASGDLDIEFMKPAVKPTNLKEKSK